MIKRVIYLVESTFSIRDYERFGIHILKENGFDVEIWDATPMLQPATYKSYTPEDKFTADNLIVFKYGKELYKKLRSLKNTDFVIAMLGYYFKARNVYRAIGASKAKYSIFLANAIPDSGDLGPSTLVQRLKRLFPPTPKKILRIISIRIPFSKLPFKWFGIKPAKFVLVGGSRSLSKIYPMTEGADVVWAHTLDYDIYLQEAQTPSNNNTRSAIFLDEYLPFHPDWKHLGVHLPIEADKYYKYLNEFFDMIEKELKLSVVIASHPRAHSKNQKKYFKNRQCISGKTCNLVKDSFLVLTHASTSLSFANLFNKPVIFITFTSMNNHWQGRLIKVMARWFGKEPVSIDSGIDIDWEKELAINKVSYDNYRQAFIKTNSSLNLPFWQIVSDKLKEISE